MNDLLASAIGLVSAGLAAAAIVYLVFALVKPERF